LESERTGSAATRATIKAGWIMNRFRKTFQYGKPLSFSDWPGRKAWPNITMPLPKNVISP
jgi:hypothetical protein